jgi:hypothetical protein
LSATNGCSSAVTLTRSTPPREKPAGEIRNLVFGGVQDDEAMRVEFRADRRDGPETLAGGFDDRADGGRTILR